MMRKTRTVRMIVAGLLALALLLLAAGCVVSPAIQSDTMTVTRANQPSPAPQIPNHLVATATPTPQKQVVAVATRMVGKIVGRLSEENGCLRVGDTLAWPPEFVVSRQGDVIRVVGGWGKGEVWEFHIGETVEMGGGGAIEFTDEERKLLRIPAGCPGPYWVFGGGLRHQVTPQMP